MSDGELVRQTLSGRTSAFDELVRRWSARILAICHARVRRFDVAEELAQESLYRGFKALASLAEPQRFGPWLCGIATRVCLDWIKDKDRTQLTFNAISEQMRPEDVPDNHEAGALDDLDKADQLHRLMREVEQLPERHREVLMLYYYQDATYDELARLLDVSPATINARLTQARQMLRQRLTRHQARVEP